MGRTSFTGPVAGAYDSIPFSGGAVAMLASTTSVLRWKAPAAGVILETDAVVDDAAGGAPQYSVVATAGSVVAARDFLAADTHETLTPTSSPALANRTFAKGDEIAVSFITGVGETPRGLLVTVSVRYTGHIVASADND